MKIAPNTIESNDSTDKFENKNKITPEEEGIIKKIPGGTDLISLLENLELNNSSKYINYLAEAKAALKAIRSGKEVIHLGLEVFKEKDIAGKKAATEFDVITSQELIQVKSGDAYKTATKLISSDKTQFSRSQQIAKGTLKVYDENGNLLKLPNKLAYQFPFQITEQLEKWFETKGVDVIIGV